MSEKTQMLFRRAFESWKKALLETPGNLGRITAMAAIGSGVMGLVLGSTILLEVKIPHVSADDVSTSVTVLNTAPSWTVDAQESPASATSTPTLSGSAVTWIATATDSSGDNYFLLICKSSTTPPTAISNAPPTCGGGISNRWAISATTTSGAQATAATTTKETFPFHQENNDWTAWICDSNVSLPRCNDAYRTGTGDAASPFVVNHPPVFSAISNDGPANPGGSVTWTTASYDNDTITGSNDTVRLFVCKASDFTGTACGAAGGWATSTLVTSNAATTTIITIPTQDALYSAFVYVIDGRGRTATSTFQGSNSSFTINNVAPSLSAALISLEAATTSVGNIILTTPAGTSGPFYVKFTATDNNSCLATVGNEVVSAYTNVYRSGIGSAGCNTPGEYNSNNCYAASSTLFSNYVSCTQDVGSCSGTSDSDSTWTCSFPLWFNADPTDGTAGFTPWSAENWLATVSITDDDGLYSPETETAVGNEIASFLAFNVTQTSIAYGGLQPNEDSGVFSTTTDLIAQGNIGLNEDVYGDTMCTSWTAPDSCDSNGISPLNDITVDNQKFATSAVAYASSFAYALTSSSTPSNVDIQVQKTIATSSLQTKNTHWGIKIPATITQAGAYSGQNTITAKKSPIAFW